MIRSLVSVGLLVAGAVAVAATGAHAAAAPTSSAALAHGVQLCQHDYGCCGDEWGCGEHRDCCCCHHKVPEITVHVIQPPPTFIYDVTHTACYTEHHDCCGCPYVCGPTCLPQGEVLAPANVGRKVAVSDCGKDCKHHHHCKKDDY
ncbi:hypothetical protein H4S06_005114 [Coemansia sp. BCRC 34490]|nr:hypothetical protein GGI11_007106 [Coemansia sp. RSA 2049]KAJ2513257.1 hypothetical protein H4217_006434 [Coemansia sp. RSA 1939]KAJ2604727.1 hypothetical protein EV177_006330 [Coemansia sp. RSA 1804]KAJ2666132.1 hypothetical protein GGH99_006790 [Coemansia sp. RSA 1285]KAJ2747716.1 hypothetical protein H4S06_005114 [Coemansia sp. BCRC 34490]